MEAMCHKQTDDGQVVYVTCIPTTCQLPRNSSETTCTTSPEKIEVMKLKCYSKTMCNKHVQSTMTRSCRFHFPIGVIVVVVAWRALFFRA